VSPPAMARRGRQSVNGPGLRGRDRSHRSRNPGHAVSHWRTRPVGAIRKAKELPGVLLREAGRVRACCGPTNYCHDDRRWVSQLHAARREDDTAAGGQPPSAFLP